MRLGSDSSPDRHLQIGPDFLYDKHVRYLLKSLRKIPPVVPLDVAEAHRLSSLFFIVSGLDLLNALDNNLTDKDKSEIISWIYSHQVDVRHQATAKSNQYLNDTTLINHDSSSSSNIPTKNNVPSTRTSKTNTLLNNALNSLNSSVAKDSSPSKNPFSRYAYPEDIDKLVRFDGHSGFRATSIINDDFSIDCGNISMTYCALATLCILGDRLTRVNRQAIITSLKYLQQSDGSFRPSILGGESDMRLVYCAVSVSAILNDFSGIDKVNCADFIKKSLTYEGAFGQCPGAEAHGGSTYCALASLKLMSMLDETLNEDEIKRLIRWCLNRLHEGFSGRSNKEQDTCYSFWIGACLVILDHFDFIDQDSLLNFILLSQEERGGLSKRPAFYSDPLHTYLGFAGLTFVNEKLRSSRQVKISNLDPTLNISLRAKEHLRQLHETSLMKCV